MSMMIQKMRARVRNIWLRLIDTMENSRKRARNKGRRAIQRLFPWLK
jgi:hypothetical protein